MAAKATLDAKVAPSPETLRRDVPATRTLLRRISRLHHDGPQSSFFRFLNDQSGEYSKTGIEQPAVEAGLGGYVAARTFDRAFRASRSTLSNQGLRAQ